MPAFSAAADATIDDFDLPRLIDAFRHHFASLRFSYTLILLY